MSDSNLKMVDKGLRRKGAICTLGAAPHPALSGHLLPVSTEEKEFADVGIPFSPSSWGEGCPIGPDEGQH